MSVCSDLANERASEMSRKIEEETRLIHRESGMFDVMSVMCRIVLSYRSRRKVVRVPVVSFCSPNSQHNILAS